MPYPNTPSPRAAIQDWLLHTEETRKAQGHEPSSRDKHKSRRKHREQRHRNVEDFRLRTPQGRQRIETTVGDGVSGEVENLHLPASLGHRSCDRAQRLGIRTPFRPLDGNQKRSAEKDVAVSEPKRKRSRSLEGTCLRSGARRRTVVEEGNHQHLEGLKSAREAAESGETTLQTSSHRRQSFAVAPKPFENHAKSYERKSRRKTREDYYTLKETQNAPNQNADEGKYFAKKSGRRKRRGKSGSALMHDFNAQNVAYNRLTLRSAPAVGIFSKGRASSPIKRIGLADPAFSEVTFLKSRKEKPENLGGPLERASRQKVRRVADDGAEISRYFTSTIASFPQRMVSDVESLVSVEPRRVGSNGEVVPLPEKRGPAQSNPRLPLVELPETPFLGFGSSGVTISSPVKLHKSLNTPNRSAHAQDHHMSPKKPDRRLDTQNRTPHSPVHYASPTRTTTYYTWSRSGNLSKNSLAANSPRQAPLTSGLTHECRPNKEPTSHVNGRQEMRMQDSSGNNSPHHDYHTITCEAEMQSQASGAGLQSNGALHHVEPEDHSREGGEEDAGKALSEFKSKKWSASSRADTALAERALSMRTHAPPTSHPPCPDKTTSSFKSLDAAIDRLNQRFLETPHWRAEQSTHTAVPRCGAESHESCSTSKESLCKVQALGNDRTGCKNGKSYANTADSSSGAGPAYTPSAPRIEASQILSHEGRPFEPFPSISMLDGPRPRGCELQKVSGLSTYGMKCSDMPAINAWHGYDRLYESQEDPQAKLFSGSVHFMQGYTPVQTLCSEEFLAPKGDSPPPNQDFDSCKHREKIGFQDIKERSPDSNSLLNEDAEIWHGSTYRMMHSPASQDNFLSAGDQDGRQPNQHYSQNEQSGLGGGARSEERQDPPLNSNSDIAEQSRDRARQNYPLHAPDPEDTRRSWNPVVPSHTPLSSYGFQENSSRVPPNEDEGLLAGFWKPHLLY